MIKKPAFRKLRGYAFDPSMSLKMDTAEINDIIYKIPWEDLIEIDGVSVPIGEYVEIIDYDPSVKKYYEPVNFNNQYLLAQDGIDPSESNPMFHQQMVYAVTMLTIKNFEKALGRKVLWAEHDIWDNGKFIKSEYVERLRIYPHAIREANAYYSPQKVAILYGYFNSKPSDEAKMMPDSLVFTCLSHDVIAHETTHAILDGINRGYNHPSNPDMLAFHEAFSDIIALFQHFSFKEVLKNQISKTKGDLNSQNLLGELAQEFGTAIGNYGGLRNALGEFDKKAGYWRPKVPDVESYKTIFEPHERGGILVAAVFEAFINIYKNRVSDLIRIASDGTGILRQGEIHPDLVNRLSSEAAKSASHVLRMCIRALDYCPPVDLTFGDYLRALITSDMEVLDDDRRDYRIAFVEAFRKRGIYPKNLNILSVEGLKYSEASISFKEQFHGLVLTDEKKGTKNNNTNELLKVIGTFLMDYASKLKFVSDRKEIFKITNKYIWGEERDLTENDSLYNRINFELSNNEQFAKYTGLAFVNNYSQLGVKSYKDKNFPKFKIQSLRYVTNVGPDGKLVNQVIFSIIQVAHILFDPLTFTFIKAAENADSLAYKDEPNHYSFRGGCTLIFNLDNLEMKYAITKPLLDLSSIRNNNVIKLDETKINQELSFRYKYRLNMRNEFENYFGSQHDNEPFAFLHQH